MDRASATRAEIEEVEAHLGQGRRLTGTRLDWFEDAYLEELRADAMGPDEIAERLRSRRVPADPVPIPDNEFWEERTEALAEVLAGLLRRRVDVQAFRDEVLSGRVLPEREVFVWVDAVSDDADRNVGVRHWLRPMTPHEVDRGHPARGTARIPGRGGGEVPIVYGGGRYLHVEIDDRNAGHTRPSRVTSEPLRRLKRLAERLADEAAVTESSVALFLLTDIAPTPTASMSVTMRYGDDDSPVGWHTRVVMDVPPEMPPELVATMYADARKRALGPRSRRQTMGKLALVKFVERAGGPSAGALASWNERHPEDEYQTLDTFRRSFRDARRRVLGGTNGEMLARGPLLRPETW